MSYAQRTTRLARVHAKRADYYDYDYDLGCYDCECDIEDCDIEDCEETPDALADVRRLAVKQYLGVLWSYEDEKRDALKTKALIKRINRDHGIEGTDRVIASIDSRMEATWKTVESYLKTVRIYSLIHSHFAHRCAASYLT
jgi:hypothetical protein